LGAVLQAAGLSRMKLYLCLTVSACMVVVPTSVATPTGDYLKWCHLGLGFRV
jgi:hypothetical protein